MKETQIYDVDNWIACYEVGTREEGIHTLEHLYNNKEWHALHKALWAWLAVDGKREKEEWFDFFNVPKNADLCFACSCAEEVLRGTEERKAACHFCPLPRDVYKTPNCANGLFEKWLDAKDLSKRKDLARKIALMEWEV